MTLLDRYIIRQFLLNFVILMVVIMGLVVMIDFIFQMEQFSDAGDNYAQAHGGSALMWMLKLMAGYYGPLVLLLIAYLVGLLVVAAMGFTYLALARSGELVTIISGGISLYRVAAPVLIAGGLINALALVDQEFLVSNMVDRLTMRPGDFKQPDRQTAGMYYIEDSRGDLISCGSFDPISGQLSQVTILVTDDKGQWDRRISAKTATWNDARRGWEFVGGQVIVRMDTGNVESVQPIRPPEPVAFFGTDVSPQVLKARRAAIYSSLLSMRQLSELLDNPAADRPELLRIMHSRFSMMVFNILILAIALPQFLTRVPPNPVKAAVYGAAIAIGSWIQAIVLLQFMSGSLNPVVAAWLPVVIYLPITAVVLSRIKT
ncbi:MAG: LptF/LptG family permease [Phycisphaeraceae bacterium]